MATPPPQCADIDAFDEQEVTLGTGALAVPGTLSLPHQHLGGRPGVVLLGGSGPMDRDDTLGRNKILKDLAWGLATRGIGVLRFDKVTHAHPGETGKDPDFTMADEYLPQALAALALLRAQPSIDADRVFLAGHSFGGTVAPRAAKADPSVAGLVILAGGAEPLHWAAVRQLRYLVSLSPESAAASEPAIEAMSARARMVDSDELCASTPDSELSFGAPATYWLDLRAYDPVAVAATLERPMLILQGGRDYQVTVADDLVRWQGRLADRPDVTFRVYPADNHFFFPDTGPSTPAELEPAQHMDPGVVADIADWLTGPPA